MFTGIVEELGEVVSLRTTADAALLDVRAPHLAEQSDRLAHGESVAVNGVCLTVVEPRDDGFTADVMRETLERSGLGALAPGDPVNLERALTPSSRMGGHVVLGHVDATGRVLAVDPGDRWTVVRVGIPVPLSRYVVEKGSVTVDGVSLTVVDTDERSFSVSLIPTTLAATTLGHRQVGDVVNLEVDVMAKHLEKLLAARG